jgi:uncharacterized protein YeeX (DUF496 family)
MTRSLTCQTKNARRCATHKDLDDNIDDVREHIATASQTQKELQTKLKDLTDQKKEAGRTPRHNRSTSNFDGVKIPPIHSLNFTLRTASGSGARVDDLIIRTTDV